MSTVGIRRMEPGCALRLFTCSRSRAGVPRTILVAQVGFQRRLVSVRSEEILVASIGGVLVDERHRGTGFGGRTVREARTTTRWSVTAHGSATASSSTKSSKFSS
ncbi:hypothetical protein [Paeniglutamicibacter terrestris]|uniref:GNAT family N-acetyltransferase n=1 Tax=Paeniglutamicibacter terrestris TaxID=2723403 RepID=A0ABX1GA18_9MICC|nr:hypothetical protein [Paeniglutamicibacter terrestris]NKG22884.1 hypothetical protein [Paeniglutamicibacter terrestris]